MFRSITVAVCFHSCSSLLSTTAGRPLGSRSLAYFASANMSSDNPLLQSWSSNPFSLPPFARIQVPHFEPALEQAMKTHLSDLQTIVDEIEEPSFDNTIAAYDRAGSLLDRVAGVYHNYGSSVNTPDLQEVQTKLSPVLSRHSTQCYAFPGLFQKVEKVYNQRNSLHLTPEQIRLTERIHLDFSRAGASFDEAKQKENADIQAELATLETEFMQNVLKDEETYELVLNREDLTGCPESLVEVSRKTAQDRKKGDEDYVITTSRSLVEPFLTFSDRRDLRKQAYEAWISRGEMSPERDNRSIAKKILQLRLRLAKLHGYDNFAQYQCADRMAKTPASVIQLLENVWEKAKVSANKEREALEEYIKESGECLDGGIQGWDWRYYAQKVRKAKYDFDESLLKPYLSLEAVTDAAFSVSQNLYGLTYTLREDIPAYHPDVNVYEVRVKGSDKVVALFLHDNFARPHKSGGAWMSEFRSQTRNLPPGADEVEQLPVVINNNNFAKGNSHTLLSFDDATTLFHEFGHGHHGMMSNCTYARLASTNVLTDFVELPSQLMEHWLEEPEVLRAHAKHCETGEVVPQELVDKLNAAKRFNQGYDTIEYTACALLDMLLHEKTEYDDSFDVSAFEKEQLAKLGMPQGIVMRHRPAHFLHLFSSSHYAAGYYVYLWAEVLDADAFAAFSETGNVFDPTTAAKAKQYIYSAGNTQAPDELFRQFRGRDPDIQFMLKKKGLAVEA